MAVWQFDVQLMPNAIVPDAESFIARAVTNDGFVTDHWWRENQPIPTFRDVIAEYFPPRASWHQNLHHWGDRDAVLIESWTEDGLITMLGARIDLRHVREAGIRSFCECTSDLSCCVYILEEQLVVSPQVEILVPHISASSAAQFCRDPHGFLENLDDQKDD